MPFHFCADELILILSMIPFIGVAFRKAHTWYHIKFGHKCHEKHCDAEHVEHPYSPYDRVNFQKVSNEDMEYLRGTPVPIKITIPVSIWDSIPEEDVKYRFNHDLVFFLYEEARDAGLDNLTRDEVHWYVNDKAALRVEVRDKVFLHDFECCKYGWRQDENL